MSDIMRPIPFGGLMDWILEEYRSQGTIFGVPKGPAYRSARPMFQETVEVPLGPAAGPHTQLAQNIIAAYVSGARFFELKTVQIMDGEELSKCVNKPCITAGDECYNCEWSTELTVPQAYEEYVKAWFACKLLSKELELGSDSGFVFNMSVGYDLAGIKSPKIDQYINEMMDASGAPIFQACRRWALDNLSKFKKVDAPFVEGISPQVSRSITESTLHGCPIHQDIPAYLRLVREGNYPKALEVITQRNPLPFITGTICPHHCTDKCTRDFYEEPVSIRDAKLQAAEGGFSRLLPKLKPKAPRTDVNVAVVGGGPAGMAAAFFLGREGVPVTLYEASDKLGGVVRHIIPDFRISAGAIDRDEAIVRSMGVTVQ